MLEKVINIIKHDEDYVISSDLCLILLKIYSELYLNGRQPQWCSKCMRRYFRELKKTGIMKAKERDNQTFTNKCNKKGVSYVRKAAKHFNFSNLSDTQAVWLIENEILKESDFSILPESYKKQENTKDFVKKLIQNGESRTNIRKLVTDLKGKELTKLINECEHEISQN